MSINCPTKRTSSTPQNGQSLQNLQNINFDNYGYTMGGGGPDNGNAASGGMDAGGGSSPFQDLMSVGQRSTPGSVHGNGGGGGGMGAGVHEQGLSPPYSNQSPPHSVQSNMALSPQGGYVGKCAGQMEAIDHMCYFLDTYSTICIDNRW